LRADNGGEARTTVRTRTRTRWIAAAAGLAAVATLVLGLAPALALPRSLPRYFLGGGMMRAEILVRDFAGFRDWRLDQGRVLRVLPARSTLRIRELDGRVVDLQVAPTARIELDGRPVPLAGLRRGVRVLVVRDGESPADTVLAGRRSLLDSYLGPGMIRAEVVVRDAEGDHDWRLDQGRILRVAPARSLLRIFEHDGRVEELQVAPDARIELHGRPVPLAFLRRGMRVLVVREGAGLAEVVLAGRR